VEGCQPGDGPGAEDEEHGEGDQPARDVIREPGLLVEELGVAVVA
jgi:hypothetical protein